MIWIAHEEMRTFHEEMKTMRKKQNSERLLFSWVFSILLILECSASVILGYNHTTKISYTETSGKTCLLLPIPSSQISDLKTALILVCMLHLQHYAVMKLNELHEKYMKNLLEGF